MSSDELRDAFVAGLEAILGGRMVGVVRYGAMCFPPSPVSDFDAHVFVRDPFSDDDRRGIVTLLERLRDVPGGDDMDVWYVTMDAARSRDYPQTELRPGHRDWSWALHRAHWHAGRFELVRGPDPRTIVPEPTWDEIDASLQAELGFVEDHLGDAPAFSVLNLCRILYSYEMHDVVVGKYQAAIWAHAFLDNDRHGIVRRALEAYASKTYTVDGDVGPFYEELCTLIERARAFS